MFQGVVNDVQIFLSEELALRMEQEWLKGHSIKNDEDRECKAQNGIELIIWECELKPRKKNIISKNEDQI